MIKTIRLFAAAALVAFAGTSAQAATDGTFVGVFGGNEECPQPGGNKTAVGALAGSFCLAKFLDTANGEQGTNAALTGVNILDNFTITGAAGDTSGTWSFADQGEGFEVTHLIIKGSNNFSVWDVTGLTSGSWMTGPELVNQQGIAQGISHLSFFGQAGGAVVPVPAALPLFLTALAGFGLIGWRRRQMAA